MALVAADEQPKSEQPKDTPSKEEPKDEKAAEKPSEEKPKEEEEKPKEETDNDKIQGTWEVASCQQNGMPSEIRVGDQEIYKDDTVLIRAKGLNKTFEAKFKLDFSKSPREIDLIVDVGEANLGWSGIYSLDGDTLTTCWSATNSQQSRPAALVSKEGDGNTLLVLKRTKPDGQ